MPQLPASGAKLNEISQEILRGPTLCSLRLYSFRCFKNASFDFVPGLNLIYGPNATGKTSILEAIHFLCIGKSFLSGSDRQVVLHHAPSMRLQGFFQPQAEVGLTWSSDEGKRIYVNGVLQPRLTDHVGRFTVVVASPSDHLLVDESGHDRRRFMDLTLAQTSPGYLEALLQYNRLLQQRNALLRQLEPTKPDLLLLQTVDEQLNQPAHVLWEHRSRLAEKLAEGVIEFFHELSGGKELVTVQYQTCAAKQPLSQVLAGRRHYDLQLKHTTAGMHRDDLQFLLNGQPIRHYGSQGQKKSFTLALRLAQHAFLTQNNRQAPLLLVDDYADRLDSSRRHAFLRLLKQGNFPQVLLTHTDPHDCIVAETIDNLIELPSPSG
ncbi:MAG: DNA replication and repair protein RecF [Chitinophagales bacterium]|nr:DNA replication and repair protein RecF [Chitinophagales bacterium]MDW8427718.1 DNA replication and repair protein RecF [Chitinophagales bacterium]